MVVNVLQTPAVSSSLTSPHHLPPEMLSPLPFQWEVDRAPPPSASTQHQHNAFPEGLVLMEALKEKEADWSRTLHIRRDGILANPLLSVSYGCRGPGISTFHCELSLILSVLWVPGPKTRHFLLHYDAGHFQVPLVSPHPPDFAFSNHEGHFNVSFYSGIHPQITHSHQKLWNGNFSCTCSRPHIWSEIPLP